MRYKDGTKKYLKFFSSGRTAKFGLWHKEHVYSKVADIVREIIPIKNFAQIYMNTGNHNLKYIVTLPIYYNINPPRE